MNNHSTMTFADVSKGSMWTHRNGIVYEVIEHANVEGTLLNYPSTIVYRNVSNGKVYARRLDDWARSMSRMSCVP